MKIDNEYKWLARDKDGQLVGFTEKPMKNTGIDEWVNSDISVCDYVDETDERFSFIKWEDNEPIKISDIRNILAIDSSEVCTSVHGVEPLGISIQDAVSSMMAIGNVGLEDSNDIISKPSHYIGINGLEVEQILAEFLPRFTDGYEAHRVGSAIEYLLRSPLKNGEEDIEKAGQNIEQIKRYNQGKQT
ncbi:MAG: DUF3310 domain-containing protein [Carnobacterium sp.]